MLRDVVAELAVDHDVILRDRQLDGAVNAAAIGAVNLVFVRYGGQVVVEAPPTGERVALTLPLGPMRVTRGATTRTLHRQGFVLGEERPTIMHPDPHAGALVVAVPRVRLEAALTRLAGRPLGAPRFDDAAAGPLVCTSLVAAAWRHVCDVLTDVADLPRAAERALEHSLLDALLIGMPHSRSAALAAIEHEPVGHAERARDWIDAHYAQPVSVSDIAQAVGISARQLQHTMRARYGASPMRVLRDVRLEHAHRLLATGELPSVSAVAYACGFTHLGRFAGSYRSRFGASPSTRFSTAGPHI